MRPRSRRRSTCSTSLSAWSDVALACSSPCGPPVAPAAHPLARGDPHDLRGAIPPPLRCRQEAVAALLCLPKVANVTASLSFQARCTLAQLLAAKMMPEMPEMSSAAAAARGPSESAAAPQPAESAAGLQQEVAVAGVQAEYQVEYFATLEVAVRRQHVVSRPRRSSMSMSPATRPRQSVSSRPRDSVTPPPRPAAAATTAAAATAVARRMLAR